MTDNEKNSVTNLSDAEIKKALEVCGKNEPCNICPCNRDEFADEMSCSGHLFLLVLDLINRQQAEINNYKTDKEEYIKDYEDLENNLKYSEQERKFEHQRVVNLQKEIEALKEKNAGLALALLHEVVNEDEQLRNEIVKVSVAEVVKEFTDRLIDNLIYDTYSRDFLIVFIRHLSEGMG